MKKITILLLCLTSQWLFAHDDHQETPVLQQWNFVTTQKPIEGSFLMYKNGEVFIEDADHHLSHYPLNAFAAADKKRIEEKMQNIETLNQLIANSTAPTTTKNNQTARLALILAAFGLLFYVATRKKARRYAVAALLGGVSLTFVAFTDPNVIRAAFLPFAPNVVTSWDNNYFYVESKGIPTTHSMMVGISNRGWQQQVPLPHCYIGTNGRWSIPLNPVNAATPVPVNAAHFTKGAIAMAVNGVPIFNPFTNTGVDALLDGQLDNFGGHCGRGDDYHYHTAPLHLYNQTTATLPIAYAFDGYAVFGSLEPTGAAMQTLDANHGHLFAGVYHYHGTAAAPYMIANMVGVVTEDATMQIIPQPQGQPVRTENWTPLAGALITACIPNATNNGYSVTYTLNGVTGYATTYSWSGTVYTYNYVTPTGTTTRTYTGPNLAQCTLTTAIDAVVAAEIQIHLSPNPATDVLTIDLGNENVATSVQQMSIYDLNGKLMSKTEHFRPTMNIQNLPKGMYLLQIKWTDTVITKKFVVQ